MTITTTTPANDNAAAAGVQVVAGANHWPRAVAPASDPRLFVISLAIVPLEVVVRARALLRSSGQTDNAVAIQTGISLRRVSGLRAPGSAALEYRSTAVRYLRVVHGLRPKVTSEEAAQVRSLMATMTARHGERAALARALGISHELPRLIVAGLAPPGVLVWAAFFPEAIGCHDIIVSASAAIARAA